MNNHNDNYDAEVTLRDGTFISYKNLPYSEFLEKINAYQVKTFSWRIHIPEEEK